MYVARPQQQLWKRVQAGDLAVSLRCVVQPCANSGEQQEERQLACVVYHRIQKYPNKRAPTRS
jgi:hypothetical protein